MPELFVSDPLCVPGAKLLFGQPELPLTGVTINTREADLRGKLFVALKGDRADGHDFLEKAAEAGVACVLIESRGMETARALFSKGLQAAVVVPDTLKALGELARRHRAKLGAKIVAITGSNGKTSTKEFVSSILSSTYGTVSAPKSFNNTIGVPLTLLSMDSSTQAAVLEFGMNHPGELTELCRLADPDLVAITSIGVAHVGFLGSLREVALAKSEILTASRAAIPAFLPADSKFLPLLRSRASKKTVVTFGRSPNAFWRLKNIRQKIGNISFEVLAGSRDRWNFRCPDFGEHQLTNILLSIGIACQFAVPIKKIKASVSRLRLPPGRGVLHKMGRHILIDDSYNANPESMRVSLERAGKLKRLLGGRLILVLGDMLELGDETARYHRLVGRMARKLNPWKLVFVGEQGEVVRKGFMSAGGKKDAVVLAKEVDEIEESVQTWVKSKTKTILLVKASQRIQLQKAVNAVCQYAP